MVFFQNGPDNGNLLYSEAYDLPFLVRMVSWPLPAALVTVTTYPFFACPGLLSSSLYPLGCPAIVSKKNKRTSANLSNGVHVQFSCQMEFIYLLTCMHGVPSHTQEYYTYTTMASIMVGGRFSFNLYAYIN